MPTLTYTQAVDTGKLDILISVYASDYRPTFVELTYAIERSIKYDRFDMLQYLEIEHDVNLNVNILRSVSSSKKNIFGHND